MTRPTPVRRCADCTRYRIIRGVGLCATCHSRHDRAGTLDRWNNHVHADAVPSEPAAEAVEAAVDVVVNEPLRAHVTSAKFVLTLGATHIAALVYIDAELRRNRTIEEDLRDGTLAQRSTSRQTGPYARAFAHNATGTAGLIARGLLVHHLPDKQAHNIRPSDVWTITAAGQHVIGLLREAGIWHEYTRLHPDDLPVDRQPGGPVAC